MAGLFQPDQSNLLIVMPGESRWVRTGSQDRFGQEAPDTDARESRHCESPFSNPATVLVAMVPRHWSAIAPTLGPATAMPCLPFNHPRA
jgi:hypothetical protein